MPRTWARYARRRRARRERGGARAGSRDAGRDEYQCEVPMLRTLTPQDLQRLLGFLALGLVVIGNACGNVLLKLGANARGPALFGPVAWQTLGGVACFGAGIGLYAWALRQFELHVAQVVVSLQYVAAMFLASWVLGEQISPGQWLGIALIAAGLYMCLR